MSMPSGNYGFLTNEEAIAFIQTMAEELRELAEDRNFWALIPSLTSAEQTAMAMKRIAVKAE
jgi:hypothetical protein